MDYMYKLQEPANDLKTLLCLTGPLRVIFKHYNFGELADYIGLDNIFFKYSNDENKVPSLSKRRRDFFQELRNEFGLEVIEKTFSSSENGWNYVSSTLKNGVINIIFVDTFDYPMSIHYKKNHGAHYLAINGYSSEYVSIHDTGLQYYNYNIKKDIIKDAWSKTNYKIISIDINQKLRYFDENKFIEVLRENVKNIISPDIDKIYKDITIIKLPPDGYSGLKIGISAIDLLGDEVKILKDSKDTIKDITKFYNQILLVAEQTDLHSLFLKNNGERFKIPEISDLLNDIQYIAQEWRLVRNILIKATYKDTNNMIDRAANKIKNIAEEEYKFINDLGKIIC